jgi:hypothetical protein
MEEKTARRGQNMAVSAVGRTTVSWNIEADMVAATLLITRHSIWNMEIVNARVHNLTWSQFRRLLSVNKVFNES